MNTLTKDKLKILFVASEAMPFAKTGGLADVIGTLPLALTREGLDVRVIIPKYRDIDAYWKAQTRHLGEFYVNMGWRNQYCGVEQLIYQDVPFYFIDNEFYFAREAIYGEGESEGERFGFFCRAVIESLPLISFFPDIIHCHDWQTGLLPPLLKLHYRHLPDFSNIRTVFTIHNLKYQGVFNWQQIDELFGIGYRYFTPEYLEFYGGISFMKGGIVFSDYVSTVSPAYAQEIQNPYYGERLDGLLRARSDKIRGILNGIDKTIWNPWADKLIIARYSRKDISAKAKCKVALQQAFHLPVDEDAMVVCIVSRLTEQKGLDLIVGVLNDMMRLPIQLIVLGHGDKRYQDIFSWAQWRYQGKVSVCFSYNEKYAHMMYAGADLYLMPSRFEPCGISQLIALRYGTVPLVRETGGLKDTITPYNKYTDEGTGFSFANYNAHEMLVTLQQAIKYFHDKKLWARLATRGMHKDFGWHVSARQYARLYKEIMAGMTQGVSPSSLTNAALPPTPGGPPPLTPYARRHAGDHDAASNKKQSDILPPSVNTAPVAPAKVTRYGDTSPKNFT
jgi:starch synthase